MTYTIRAMAETDLEQIVALRNLPGIRWGTLSTPFESVARMRNHVAAAPQQGTHLVACAQGRVVGVAQLQGNRMARRAHSATLGINVHDDWQGKGVGTALFAALTDLADHWLGVRRLELDVFTDNAAAIALYKKFGFTIETTETCEAFRDGAYVDSHMMARLRGEFLADTAPYPASCSPAPPGPFELRAVEPEDLDAVTALMNQPRVRHGTLRLPFCTPEDNRLLVTPADDRRAIVAVDGGQAVGIVTLNRFKNRRAHVADLSLLAVHDAWHGRGIGAALLTAMLDIADNWLDLKRIRLSAFADNAPAIALYKRFGFVAEGIRRADAFRAGGFVDGLSMGRVR
jgi:putative acetyltransferase